MAHAWYPSTAEIETSEPLDHLAGLPSLYGEIQATEILSQKKK